MSCKLLPNIISTSKIRFPIFILPTSFPSIFTFPVSFSPLSPHPRPDRSPRPISATSTRSAIGFLSGISTHSNTLSKVGFPSSYFLWILPRYHHNQLSVFLLITTKIPPHRLFPQVAASPVISATDFQLLPCVADSLLASATDFVFFPIATSISHRSSVADHRSRMTKVASSCRGSHPLTDRNRGCNASPGQETLLPSSLASSRGQQGWWLIPGVGMPLWWSPYGGCPLGSYRALWWPP